MAKKNMTEIKGWTTLCAGGWWDGDDAMWARKAKDGSYYVLKFTNLLEAGGDEFADTPYECAVKRIDLADTPMKEIESAIHSCGWSLQGDVLVSYAGDELCRRGDKQFDLMLVQTCIEYGLGAPLGEFYGKHRPVNVRGQARRAAEELMRDASALDAALDRPVNALGSTAREYGKGDIDSAMGRAMGRIEDSGAPSIVFATLHKDGSVSNQREIKTSDVKKCRHKILVSTHYRDDGSCKCDDAAEREMMEKKWGYSSDDFVGVALRTT